MPTIITSGDKPNTLRMYNPDPDMKIGRWCAAPLIPDRCNRCFDDNLRHYDAEYYYEEEGPDAEGRIWRKGACHRCMDEVEKEHKAECIHIKGSSDR